MDVTRIMVGHQIDSARTSQAGSMQERLDEFYDALVPYFRNKQVLENALQYGVFYPEFDFLSDHKNNIFLIQSFEWMLDKIYSTYLKNKSRFIRFMNDREAITPNAVQNIADLIQNHTSKNDTTKTARVKYIMSVTGSLLEGTLLDYLRFFQAVMLIDDGEEDVFDTVKSTSFGNVVNHVNSLIQIQEINDLGYGISLSQLRNVIYHHSYSMRRGEVVMEYGSKGQYNLSVDIKDLSLMQKRVWEITSLYKTAITIFMCDVMREYVNPNRIDTFEWDQTFGNLGVLAQDLHLSGFQVIKASFESNELKISLKYIGKTTKLDVRNKLEGVIRKFCAYYEVVQFKIRVETSYGNFNFPITTFSHRKKFAPDYKI